MTIPEFEFKHQRTPSTRTSTLGDIAISREPVVIDFSKDSAESKKDYQHRYYERNKEQLLARGRRWYQKHKEKMKLYRIGYNRTNKDVIADKRRGSKQRFQMLVRQARKRKINVGISFEEFESMLGLPCYFHGEMFDRGCGHGIDRLDSSKGYETGNVVPCCVTCNRMKLRMTETKFLEVVGKIYTNRIGK